MMVYDGIFTHIASGLIVRKVGHTQKKFLERFSDPSYDIFNKKLNNFIYFSRPDWNVAKNLALKIEDEVLKGFKKSSSFIIEDYLGMEPNALNDQFGKPMSGITEMFVLETPERIQQFNEHFNKIKLKYHEGN